ncbi:glycosyltransferase, partial [Candidatus Peregrinibacteria bacterium]|nr:glycosyltransferase [Candidatus Peregrinibacteria bacterium]
MRRIAIDCRFAGTASGLGRYTRELVASLTARNDDAHYLLLVLPEAKAWLSTVPSSMHRSAVEVSARHYSLSEHREMPVILRKHNVDLLFSPHFTVPLFCPVPFVVTIHDLILHSFPNASPLWKRMGYRLLMRHAVRNAKTIITISGFVAGEIARTYGARTAARTQVITEGVDACFRRRSPDEQKQVRERYGIDGPFFLYVGNAKQHKNVAILLQAFSRLPESSPRLVLVTGG